MKSVYVIKSTYAVYAGMGELILSNDLGEPIFVVDGTLDDARFAAKTHWEEIESEVFESDTKVDPDWDTHGDTFSACSPLGYWVAIKPVELVGTKQEYKQ